MTKKDYIKIAELIRGNEDRVQCIDDDERGSHIIYWRPFVEELCDILQEDNSRFDRQRFIEACQ